VLDAQRDAAQGLDLLLGAHVVGAPQVLDDDDIAGWWGCLFHFVFGTKNAVQSHPNLFLCLPLSAASISAA
jgi:hypothetical protein